MQKSPEGVVRTAGHRGSLKFATPIGQALGDAGRAESSADNPRHFRANRRLVAQAVSSFVPSQLPEARSLERVIRTELYLNGLSGERGLALRDDDRLQLLRDVGGFAFTSITVDLAVYYQLANPHVPVMARMLNRVDEQTVSFFEQCLVNERDRERGLVTGLDQYLRRAVESESPVERELAQVVSDRLAHRPPLVATDGATEQSSIYLA